MYEHYLTAFRNGVTDIDIEINEQQFWSDFTDDGEAVTDAGAVTVTVSFAVTTDSEAWITIDGNGFVYPAFGGTGTNQRELNEYAEQAVQVWRTVTGDEETTCRYKIPETDSDDRDQDDVTHVIDA